MAFEIKFPLTPTFYERALIQQVNAINFSLLRKKLSDGKKINGKERLTNLHIDGLQSLYGHFLKSNKRKSDAMAKEIMDTLYHYSTSEENPSHQYCPEGET